jgi:hypothetical protein
VCLGFIEFCPSAKFDRADEADIAGRAAKCAASGAFAAEADASAREAPYPQRRARKATGRARRAAVLGNKIGRDIAEVVLPAVGTRAIGVVDPFAGSCNGLYAILRYLPDARGIGFEV